MRLDGVVLAAGQGRIDAVAVVVQAKLRLGDADTSRQCAQIEQVAGAIDMTITVTDVQELIVVPLEGIGWNVPMPVCVAGVRLDGERGIEEDGKPPSRIAEPGLVDGDIDREAV